MAKKQINKRSVTENSTGVSCIHPLALSIANSFFQLLVNISQKFNILRRITNEEPKNIIKN